MKLPIQKLRPNAVLPRRATEGTAGLDLCACLEAPMTLAPGEIRLVPTGVAVALPPDTVGLVCGRSGLGVKHGVTLANSVGVIDCDYRGELNIGLINHGREPYTIQPGERCAQLLVLPILMPSPALVERLDETARGTGGFGSTGRT